MIRPIPRATRLSLIPLLILMLFSWGCGGSGASGGSGESGRLMAESRPNGIQAAQGSPFRDALELVMSESASIVNNLSEVRFPSNLPVFFSGCGSSGAFFIPRGLGTVHAGLLSVNPGVDANSAFGPDRSAPALLFCNELSERALDDFNQQPFSSVQEVVFASAVFTLQVLFHEVGHALEAEYANRFDLTAMRSDFDFPIADQCSAPNCDTASEDFADWISSLTFSLAIEKTFASNQSEGESVVQGFIVALDAWPRILGSGGNPAHGFTAGRQANILCYVYGGTPQLRAADLQAGSPLTTFMTQQGIASPATSCQATFQRNGTATASNLGFAFVD